MENIDICIKQYVILAEKLIMMRLIALGDTNNYNDNNS